MRNDLSWHTLAVTFAGTGSGSVQSTPTGVACTEDCAAEFTAGTLVTLTATAGPTATFVSWAGACSGAGACIVALDDDRAVTATFAVLKHDLTIVKTGSGAGTVTSTPGGLDCGSLCLVSYTHGTTVTLAATPAISSTFVGWGGACSGVDPCTVTMDAARSVTANFVLKRFTLQVKNMLGATVISSPPGIDCGDVCAAEFPYGTQVKLSFVAGAPIIYRWQGACTGSQDCAVTLDDDKQVDVLGAAFHIYLQYLVNRK
jgi:hypothetical protein